MTLTKEQMRAMGGFNKEGGTPFYKLNKVQMSGDDGEFSHTDLLSPREQGVKPTQEKLGKTIEGVIIKMRWALSKYDEPTGIYTSSTEYDNKNTDQVMIFPNKAKGSVIDMKEQYGLSTQRIIYFYMPKKQQVVRLIVKASALTGDKNPNQEMGLFEYQSFLGDALPCEVLTTCTGVFREGKNKDGSSNRRKDHYAMSFVKSRDLKDEEFQKVMDMMVDVDTALNTSKPVNDVSDIVETDGEAAQDAALTGAEINPSDIPF